MTVKCKIKPCVSSGIAFLAPDGRTMDMLPFQVIRMSDGGTVIRIGRNTLCFDAVGAFDGNECRVEGLEPGSPEAAAILEKFAQSERNEGQAPAAPYYKPGTRGYEDEIAGWPKRAGQN